MFGTAEGDRLIVGADTTKKLLFIGCRNPQKLIVMSADDGKVVADLPIGAGVDATGIDGNLAFASFRNGKLEVAGETAGKWGTLQTVTIPVGARTIDVDTTAHLVLTADSALVE